MRGVIVCVIYVALAGDCGARLAAFKTSPECAGPLQPLVRAIAGIWGQVRTALLQNSNSPGKLPSSRRLVCPSAMTPETSRVVSSANHTMPVGGQVLCCVRLCARAVRKSTKPTTLATRFGGSFFSCSIH